MKILITGGAGYLGGSLTDILMKQQHETRVYDSLLYEESYLKKIPFVFGDIQDTDLLKEHVAWADVVVWLAALVGDGACGLNPTLSTKINQEAVEWLAENFNGRILFTSTCSVYGARDGILTEDAPISPVSVYGKTKIAAEEVLKKKNAMIFRLGTLFGLGDNYSRTRFDLVVNTLTGKAVTEGRIQLHGGNQFRPLLHVRDAAEALAKNLTTEHKGVFNLHSQNMKMRDLASLVIGRVPGTTLERLDAADQDIRNYRVSSAKAKKAFGFDPKRALEDGIDEIKQLLEEKRIKHPNDTKYTNEGYLAQLTDSEQVDESDSADGRLRDLQLIGGGLSVDDRGQVTFVNDFDFNKVKRFYTVSNHKEGVVRAWHAHQKEAKYVLVTRGAALVGAVGIDDWENPSQTAEVQRFVLSAHIPQLLYIPAGYANGFMTLTADTQVLFYSTATLQESVDDDFRFDSRYWDIWQVEER